MENIKNLIYNYPKQKECKIIDLILESGAANGSYHLGCVMYLFGLEQKNIIKIDRISGSSIGSIIALYYFTNTLDEFFKDYQKLRECFKQNLNVKILKDLLKNKISLIDDKTFNLIKTKLYIVYHSINNREQIIKTNFKDKEDLYHSILKSSHIPYITDGNYFYEHDNDKFFDGGIPYIFPERNSDNNIVYVSINNLYNLNGFFSVKKEKNNYGRFLKGALDAHQLFLYNKRGIFCSYINNWNIFDYFILRFKQLFMKIIFFTFISFYYVFNMLYPYIGSIVVLQNITTIFKNIYRDVILFYCL